MSIITLQFGQCGNQIGQELYKVLNDDINSNRHHSHYANIAINKWFNISPKTETLEARSILIDTETKTAPTPTPYRFRNSLLKNHGGCANNWAYGHNCKSQLYEDDILNSVRNEVEKCDYLSSILNIFSSSGGTGSGLGSALTEKIRDEFPSKSMINVLVLPYSSGELVTQNYNTLLCLGNIYPNADACILFENDRLTHICNHSQNLNDVNFSDVNALIAQQLGAIFQPICNVNNFELVQNLTSNARFKFVQTRSVPEVSKVVSGFEAMSLDYKHLVQHLSKPSRYDYGVEAQSKLKLKTKFIANALIARGDSLEFKKTCLKTLQNSGSYVDWLGVEERFRVYNEANGFNGMAKSLVLVSNSNSVCHRLDAVVEEAWKLFTHGAYLHHYKNFGVDEEYFLNAFQLMENILHNYKNV